MKRCYHRIVIYVTSLDPSHGGMEKVTHILSRELVHRGYEMYAIYTNNLPADKRLYSHYKSIWQGDSTRKADIQGFIRFIKCNQIDIFLNQIFTSYSSVALQKAIKEETSTVLVNVFHTTPLLLDSLKVFHRSFPFIPQILNRILFSIHKIVNLRPRYRRGNRLSYELCDAFVMLSSHYFSEFSIDNKINDTSKLYAIANPCEVFSYNQVQKEKIFLVVARLNNSQKRIDRTLRFWKRFHETGDGWKLSIVGTGPDKEMLCKMADNLDLRDYSFEGHSDFPEYHYNRAMIFMMTSDVEGFGMTLIEAMSADCVPVAMDCYSALSDIVIDGYNGMIVPKDDITDMITATGHIIANFDEMSANARESVKRFDVVSVVDKWEELFGKL